MLVISCKNYFVSTKNFHYSKQWTEPDNIHITLSLELKLKAGDDLSNWNSSEGGGERATEPQAFQKKIKI